MPSLSDAPVAPAFSLEVRPSAIHGRGVFAAELIPCDALLGLYEGPRVDADSPQADGPFVLWVELDQGETFGIDGRNQLRFVNHSLQPNAAFYGPELYALRDIQPGEEITHHYGDDWAEVP
jgi:SET domain-containing protein